MSRLVFCAALFATLLLVGCDALGIDSPEKIAALRDADGRAIGGACRHAGRAIEDCYALNRKADRSAVFTGWREMNDYMRENKIEAVAPTLGAEVSTAAAKPVEVPDDSVAAKPAGKARAAKAKAHDS